jgi:hypothetical protein
MRTVGFVVVTLFFGGIAIGAKPFAAAITRSQNRMWGLRLSAATERRMIPLVRVIAAAGVVMSIFGLVTSWP